MNHSPKDNTLNLSRQKINSWALSRVSECDVVSLHSADDCYELLRMARREGRTVAPRGNGCSFADANQNTGQLVADCTGFNQILDWDSTTGIIRVEPGVSFADMILMTFPDGWAVPCVPGGQHITVGGAISFNVHGKDGFKKGNFGSHVRRLKLLTPQLAVLNLSPEGTPVEFQAVVGGMGLLGIIIEAEIQMVKIASAMVDSQVTFTDSAIHSLQILDSADSHDFAIAWVDALSPSPRLGRGFVNLGTWSSTPEPIDMSQLRHSLETPEFIFRILPKHIVWKMLGPFWRPTFVRWINALYLAALKQTTNQHRMPLKRILFTEQVFMHNTVPDINLVYKGYGFVEIQALMPRSLGHAGVVDLLKLCNKLGAQSLLSGIKRHLPDAMMLSFSADAYTLGIDLQLRGRDRKELASVMRRIYEHIVTHGGKAYLAKDEMMTRDVFQAMYPRYPEFLGMKARLDPECIMVTDLARRLLL